MVATPGRPKRGPQRGRQSSRRLQRRPAAAAGVQAIRAQRLTPAEVFQGLRECSTAGARRSWQGLSHRRGSAHARAVGVQGRASRQGANLAAARASLAASRACGWRLQAGARKGCADVPRGERGAPAARLRHRPQGCSPGTRPSSHSTAAAGQPPPRCPRAARAPAHTCAVAHARAHTREQGRTRAHLTHTQSFPCALVTLLHAVRQGTCTETQAGCGVSLHTILV